MELRTDLALEVRESFPEDEVEVNGVSLETETYQAENIKISTVVILNEYGSKQMNKPIGTYITFEFADYILSNFSLDDIKTKSFITEKLSKTIRKLEQDLVNSDKSTVPSMDAPVLVVGLGNRFATPDALGPQVLDQVQVNRHTKMYLESATKNKRHIICGLAPGVMGQTGMESQEILKGIIGEVHPAVLLVVDALASRSTNRLCTTIQITNTGISPGSGIGNNRNALNRETLGIPVISIGVPTVVDAMTIVSESMEEVLRQEGFSEQERELFLCRINAQHVKNLFVTPKDIDEQIRTISKMVASAINEFVAS